MAIERPEIVNALRDPHFLKTICDLHETIERVESEIQQWDPQSKVNVNDWCGFLNIDVDSRKLKYPQIRGIIERELIAFEERTGMLVFAMPHGLQG